jgi:hypothetical protein
LLTWGHGEPAALRLGCHGEYSRLPPLPIIESGMSSRSTGSNSVLTEHNVWHGGWTGGSSVIGHFLIDCVRHCYTWPG